MRIKGLTLLAALLVVGAGGFLALSTPQPITAASLPQHTPDIANGERMYHIGGCISCHMPAEDAAGMDPALPTGGKALPTPIGILFPPNITPDPLTGIGAWSDADFVNAMQRGIAPDGRHFVPAFPYISYGRMRVEDVLDLKAYLMTLPAIAATSPPAELPAPWLLRRGIGLWQHLARLEPIQDDPSRSAGWNRGAYLVNGPGHCAECHTPRNSFMIMDTAQAFAGGPHPEGRGKVPSLRRLISNGYYIDANDIAAALKEGEDGGYEGVSKRGMGEVQRNIAQLPDSDIDAIAEYLSTLD